MRVAAVQISLAESKEQNLLKALEMISRAEGCDLVVLPEMLMGKRTDDKELFQIAEDVDSGHFASALKEAAVKHKLTVCTCLWEDSGSDRVYNTAVAFSPDGTLSAKYRKLHLFDALNVRESDFMLRGDSLPPVFECGGVQCGLSVCYDLRFPEIYRSLVRRGAQLFVLPAAWYDGEMKLEHLHTLLAARAIENTSYSLCANLCGDSFCGGTAVYAPFGERESVLENAEGLAVCEIDINRLEHVRSMLPCLKNFRDDIL